MGSAALKSEPKELQLSTFSVHGMIYALAVTDVQEILKPMPLTPVPHSPDFVVGLINLRGQVATAVGLMELFGLGQSHSDMMNIVCNIDGKLIAFQVDDIGDVIELESKSFETAPVTLSSNIRKFLKGVGKCEGEVLSIIDLSNVKDFFNSLS